MSAIDKDIEHHWTAIQPIFSIRNEKEYNQAIQRLEQLLDEVGTNEFHPLYELLDTLGTLIHKYEEENYPIPDCDGSDVLVYMMEEHNLSASDLTEIGDTKTIEKIINKKQALTVSQIRALSKRFQISSGAFI